MSKSVAAEIVVLEGLDTPALRARWAQSCKTLSHNLDRV